MMLSRFVEGREGGTERGRKEAGNLVCWTEPGLGARRLRFKCPLCHLPPEPQCFHL